MWRGTSPWSRLAAPSACPCQCPRCATATLDKVTVSSHIRLHLTSKAPPLTGAARRREPPPGAAAHPPAGAAHPHLPGRGQWGPGVQPAPGGDAQHHSLRSGAARQGSWAAGELLFGSAWFHFTERSPGGWKRYMSRGEAGVGNGLYTFPVPHICTCACTFQTALATLLWVLTHRPSPPAPLSGYTVPRNLLLRFSADTIDQTPELASTLQSSAIANMLELTVRKRGWRRWKGCCRQEGCRRRQGWRRRRGWRKWEGWRRRQGWLGKSVRERRAHGPPPPNCTQIKSNHIQPAANRRSLGAWGFPPSATPPPCPTPLAPCWL